MTRPAVAKTDGRRALLGAGLIAAIFQPAIAFAQPPALPADAPPPLARPFAPTVTPQSPMNLVTPTPRPSRPDPLVTSAVGPLDNPAGIGGALKSGLDTLYARDIAGAMTVRDGLPRGSLDRQILTWAIATSGMDGVASRDIAAAETELAGWPGMAGLRRDFERALFRENPPPPMAIAAFAQKPPQTDEGTILLARAHLRMGDTQKAHALLAPWWASRRLEAAREQSVLKEFSGVLTQKDHRRRFLHALYNDRLPSAKLLAGPAQGQSLYAAFAAAAQKPSAAVAPVDPAWRDDPAYLFLQIRTLRRAGRHEDAAELMLKAPRDAASLTDPDIWWNERRIVSRGLLDLGKPQLAYDIAAVHAAESPAMAAEAEFHAGWYALRALKQPKLAAPHFAKLAEISSRPISASRAWYWMGRAAEAGAEGDAQAFYRRSAHFGTTFYGQLAAAKLGEKAPELSHPTPDEAERTRFAARPAVRAIERLEQAGYASKAAPLYGRLAQELDSIGELALLAAMAERNENHFLALRVGKTAALRGLDVGALSHPLGAIPASADIAGSGKALAYAIARQESEFNVGAVSRAGARGLLQLMPATAKSVASRKGMNFSAPKLTADAGYNATLGAHFLGEQLDRFNGSYVLTFAAYNAGPRRAAEWIERFGDPRGKPVEEVVDWIERIPFSETRNYVQRVMENYEVYKTRLTGSADITADLVSGRR